MTAVDDHALRRDAAESARRLVRQLLALLSWRDRLPDHLAQVSDLGFHSMAGTDVPAIVRRLAVLRADLKARDRTPREPSTYRGGYRADLQGVQAYCAQAADGVDRLNVLDRTALDALRRLMADVAGTAADLLDALDRLECR